MSRRLFQGGIALSFLFLLLAVGWIGNTRVYAASPSLTLNLPTITAIVGRPWSGTIATGTDSLAGDTLTSTIEWGDGSQSHPTVTLAQNGTFQIRTSHTFTVARSFLYQVSVTSATNSGIVETATVTVTTARLTLKISAITATVGKTWHGTIATGTDSLAGDKLTSTIEWGDGSQSHPTITLAQNGTFQIRASHTFAIAGNVLFQVSVTSTSSSGIATTATVTVTAARALKLGNPCIFTRGKTAFLLVTFSNNQGQTKAADYKATVNWGDGTTTAGIIWNNWSGKDFIMLGRHQYKHHGTFAIKLTITDSDNSVTKTKTIVV